MSVAVFSWGARVGVGKEGEGREREGGERSVRERKRRKRGKGERDLAPPWSDLKFYKCWG